ncbi:TPA: hypothetical protein N0F65_000854 [Lagenidium giganteum]|uniref:D-serine dehydratase-like domain-containing protein n=1 Tax=Lagenidium giganteum TaxID=4803 RepID=A0AAV2YHF4_9STRA|nr:TPA: hypothetical protein N0F65_000854 [Lagenidium giganteum]
MPVAALGVTATAAALAIGAHRYLHLSPALLLSAAASCSGLQGASGRHEVLVRRRPATIGDSLERVETPCLVVDLDAMEKNLVKLPATLRDRPSVAIRPHAKAHKCAEIGHLQLQHSKAVGLCCQKIAEAEAMFAGGIKDLLLSNEVFGTERYERMAALVRAGANVTLIFDHEDAIKQAQAVAEHFGARFRALVDVNVGQNRCGVDSVEDALRLARLISQSPHLELRGIQAYHGSAQHIRNYDQKHDVIKLVSAKAKAIRDALKADGLCCDVVTGGGTGTYMLEAASGVFTEVQPGSYLFNDADYARNFGKDGEYVRDWEQSLFVLTSVMSVNARAPRSVVDAGTKAVSLDSGAPLVHAAIDGSALPPLEYQGGGDEHGILVPSEKSDLPMPAIGSKLLLTPGHCDPTTNLYDFIVGYRKGIVENVWQIGARGPGN